MCCAVRGSQTGQVRFVDTFVYLCCLLVCETEEEEVERARVCDCANHKSLIRCCDAELLLPFRYTFNGKLDVKCRGKQECAANKLRVLHGR